jgi:signal transduction histidine kinase/ActR/RegA family two-component response regulator
LYAQPQLWHNSIHPDDLSLIEQVIRETDTGKPFCVEYRIRNAEGNWHWFEDRSFGYKLDGEDTIIEGLAFDITDRKQAKEEKSNLEAQLFQSQKMEAIGTLAGGIAHDFNNILAVIIGYTELARDKNQKQNKEQYLQETLNGAQRAKNLVKQILAFSRQDGNEKKPLDIKVLLKEAVKFLRSSIPATVEINQQLTKEECNIMADPTQMHQVIMNLCTNAAHAMKDTGGTLKIDLANLELAKDEIPNHPELQQGHYVKLTVSDTGYGIDPALIQRVFDPFFTTKSVDEGTGLGLSVVYGIVKGHGGVINVYSEPGKGAIFHVYLPRIMQTETMEEDAGKTVMGGTERILFVDDEPSLVDIGMRMLSSLGYRTTVAENSIEALEIFTAGPQSFDLVITDMTLPKMTGIDLSRKLLQIRPEIPIILCSGIKEPETEARAKSLGIKAYLTKPLTRKELARVIREVLGEKAED